MNGKGWVGLLVFNLGVLIATSPSNDWFSDSSDPIAVILSPETPGMLVEGEVNAGEAFEHLSLSLVFEGTNFGPSSGFVSFYVLSPGETLPAEGDAPAETALFETRKGEDIPVSFDFSVNLQRPDFGPFTLFVEINGEALFDGALIVSAGGGANYSDDDRWIDLSKISVEQAAP